MYKYTRQEVADLLWISTRSVDRYTKSWKIRSEKRWKIIYLNSQDVENLRWWNQNQEVIVEKNYQFEKKEIKPTIKEVMIPASNVVLDKVYFDLKEEIKDKDRLIKELSLRVGQAEEIVRNSVSLIDYKKSQLLLEESKTNLNQAIIDLESDKENLEKELKSQRVNNWILLLALVLLFWIAWTLFLLKI